MKLAAEIAAVMTHAAIGMIVAAFAMNMMGWPLTWTEAWDLLWGIGIGALMMGLRK